MEYDCLVKLGLLWQKVKIERVAPRMNQSTPYKGHMIKELVEWFCVLRFGSSIECPVLGSLNTHRINEVVSSLFFLLSDLSKI